MAASQSHTQSQQVPRRVKTNFEKVQEFNRAFDMVPAEPEFYSDYCESVNGDMHDATFDNIRPKLFKDSPQIVKLRLDLIKEEIEELNEAILAVDPIETRDALADILYVVYGMADVLGININAQFRHMLDMNPISNTYDSASALEYMTTICKYSNSIDSSRYLGLTNYNWIQARLDLFPDIFLNIPDYAELTVPHKLAIIQRNINTTYKNLEVLCKTCLINIDNPDNLDNPVDFGNIADIIVELLKWVYSYCVIAGIDADRDFAIVHDSNMSKLCSNEAEAQATVADYTAKYVSGKSPYDTPYYYYLPKLDKWIVKNRSTGKALKNINYKKVNFNQSITQLADKIEQNLAI